MRRPPRVVAVRLQTGSSRVRFAYVYTEGKTRLEVTHDLVMGCIRLVKEIAADHPSSTRVIAVRLQPEASRVRSAYVFTEGKTWLEVKHDLVIASMKLVSEVLAFYSSR